MSATVKSGHVRRKRSCLLYPKADMCTAHVHSALGQKRTISNGEYKSAIFKCPANYILALWALKGTLIVSRFIRLNPR